MEKESVIQIQTAINLEEKRKISPYGTFGKITQEEVEKFLKQNVQNLDKQISDIKPLISQLQKVNINNSDLQSPSVKSSNNQDNLVSSNKLAEIENKLQSNFIVTCGGFIALFGLVGWLFYVNIKKTIHTPQNLNVLSDDEPRFTKIEKELQQKNYDLQQLADKVKELEKQIQSQKSNTYISPPTNFDENSTQSTTTITSRNSQISTNQSSQITFNNGNQLLGTYNSNPRSLSKKAIIVSESEDTLAQRRTGFSVKPILEKNNLGNYWIFIEGNDQYLLPKGGIKINEHNFGTISVLFNCIGYEQRKSSNNFTLLKPAKVSLRGQHWEFIEPGEIQF